MSHPGPLSERAVILAPTGRDGPLAALIVEEAGFAADVCPDLSALEAELFRGSGLAIIALLEKFGADSMVELARNVDGYRDQLTDY